MYMCPECGAKLDKNATICPCCGRGNKDNRNNKYDFLLIVIGLILFSVGFITTVSYAYDSKEMVYYGVNYSFTYKNSNWATNKKLKALDDNSEILLYNNGDNIYIQFDKEMNDMGFDTNIDSSREDLYNALYRELVTYSTEYTNVSSEFKQIGEKYYIDANYQKSGIKAKLYVLCYKTKVMTFYIVHDGKDYREAEEKLFEIFKNIEVK